jgi:hypothetical protein
MASQATPTPHTYSVEPGMHADSQLTISARPSAAKKTWTKPVLTEIAMGEAEHRNGHTKEYSHSEFNIGFGGGDRYYFGPKS